MYGKGSKIIAKTYMKALRDRTVCAICGRQPVDFHHKDPDASKDRWIAHLTVLGFPIPRIEAELAVCEPLCRSCHMKQDGRLAFLNANKPFPKGVQLPPKPCTSCGIPAKPLRKGLCNKCNHQKRRDSKRNAIL